MTEAEWLACDKPERMLRFLEGAASDRKLRLFGCACCRRVWHLFGDGVSRGAVEIAERFADGGASSGDLLAAQGAVNDDSVVAYPAWFCADHGRDCPASRAALAAHWLTEPRTRARSTAESTAVAAYYAGADALRLAILSQNPELGWDAADASARHFEETPQCHLLRDVFGNPFRPVAVDPAWLTPNVVGLARTIYDERAFDRLPILADALLDAGCDNPDILEDCRS